MSTPTRALKRHMHPFDNDQPDKPSGPAWEDCQCENCQKIREFQQRSHKILERTFIPGLCKDPLSPVTYNPQEDAFYARIEAGLS